MAPRAPKSNATSTTSTTKPKGNAKKGIPRVQRPVTPNANIEGKRTRKQVERLVMPESCRVVYKRKPTIAQVRAKALAKEHKELYKPYVPGQVCIMRESYSPPEIRRRPRKPKKNSARRAQNRRNQTK